MTDNEIPLSKMLYGEIVSIGEARPKAPEKPIKTPEATTPKEESLEITVEEEYTLKADETEETPKEKVLKVDTKVTEDRYQFPVRDPSKVKLKSYFAYESANEIFRDLIFITNLAILESKIKAPPTGLFEEGDLFTICAVATQENGKDPHIPEVIKDISFPYQILLDKGYNIRVWSAEDTKDHPDALNQLGELVRSLDKSLYQKTKIVLQVRKHFKGKGLTYEEIAKKYFPKVTDTSKFEKLEPETHISFTAITDALKKTAISKKAKFEDDKEQETPKPNYTKDTVRLSPEDNPFYRADTAYSPSEESKDVVIITKGNKIVGTQGQIEEARRKLAHQNHDQNIRRQIR